MKWVFFFVFQVLLLFTVHQFCQDEKKSEKGGVLVSEAYKKNAEEIIKEFETNIDKGLTNEELKSRQEEHGPNELAEQ